jgi:hypothetical protein
MKKGVSSLADTWLTILAGARSKFGLSRYIMSTPPNKCSSHPADAVQGPPSQFSSILPSALLRVLNPTDRPTDHRPTLECGRSFRLI